MLLNPLQLLEAEVENTTGPSGNAALFGSQDSPFQEALQQAQQDLDAHLGQASPTGGSQTVYPSLAKLIEGILADRSLRTDPNAPKLPEWGAESEPPAQEGENLSSALGWGQAERPAPARDQDPAIPEEIQDGESRNPKEHPLSGKGLERLKDAVLDHTNPVLQERETDPGPSGRVTNGPVEAGHVTLLRRESPEPVEHPNSGEIPATQDQGSSQVEPPRRAEGDGGGILSSDSVPSGGIPFISGPSFGIQPVLERFGSEGNGGWAGGEASSRPHPAQPVLLKPEMPPEDTESESFGHLKNPQRGQPPVDPLFGEQSEGGIPESSGVLRQVRPNESLLAVEFQPEPPEPGGSGTPSAQGKLSDQQPGVFTSQPEPPEPGGSGTPSAQGKLSDQQPGVFTSQPKPPEPGGSGTPSAQGKLSDQQPGVFTSQPEPPEPGGSGTPSAQGKLSDQQPGVFASGRLPQGRMNDSPPRVMPFQQESSEGVVESGGGRSATSPLAGVIAASAGEVAVSADRDPPTAGSFVRNDVQPRWVHSQEASRNSGHPSPETHMDGSVSQSSVPSETGRTADSQAAPVPDRPQVSWTAGEERPVDVAKSAARTTHQPALESKLQPGPAEPNVVRHHPTGTGEANGTKAEPSARLETEPGAMPAQPQAEHRQEPARPTLQVEPKRVVSVDPQASRKAQVSASATQDQPEADGEEIVQLRSGDTPQTPEREAGRFSQPLDSEQDATPKPEGQRIQEVREPVSARPTQAVQAPSSPRPSQLTGNEPVQQRGPGPEVLQETHRVTDQLVRGARLLSRDGTTQVTLRLDPPELGEVTIKLATVNDTVTGEIAVGNREAYQVVRGNLADLTESLVNQGVRVDQIEVSIDQRGSAGADREPASPSSRDASDRKAEEDSDNSRQRRDPWEESRQRGSTPQDGGVDFTA